MTYWGVKYEGDIHGRGDIMRGVTYQDSDIIGWGDTLGVNILWEGVI